MISGVKMGQQSAMGISPPRAHEDSLDAWFVLEVFSERRLHGQVVACEVEVVSRDALVNEAVNLGERVGGDDVDGLES
jgi:hypothetical protein